MVKIRLKRIGAKKKPYYRIVVADSRSPGTASLLSRSVPIILLQIHPRLKWMLRRLKSGFLPVLSLQKPLRSCLR